MTKLRRDKNSEAGFTMFEVAMVLGFIVWLVVAILVIYVAHHFIVKYW